MSSNIYEIIQPNLAFRQAENMARKRSTKAWVLANHLIPRKRVKYLFLCYGYLRWVDNIIDDKYTTASDKNKFIREQIDLLKDLANKKEKKLSRNEEAYLHYFISFAIQNDEKFLIDMLSDMLTTMKMDVERIEKDGMFNDVELEKYISLSTGAMLGLVYSFMYPKQSFNSRGEIGKVLWYAGTFRDFQKDLDCGLVNVSREDFNQFSLDKNNLLYDEYLHLWLQEKVLSVIELLEAEIEILRNQPLRFRLFWCIAYPVYLHKIIRIKFYDYTLSYLKKPKMIKEIKVFLSSITLGIKIILRIVI